MRLTLFDAPDHGLQTDFTSAEYRSISYATAKRVIEANHYLGSVGAPIVSFGMFLGGEMAGAMCFGRIPGPNARGVAGDDNAHKVIELTRLYIFDWAGKNAGVILHRCSTQGAAVATRRRRGWPGRRFVCRH